MPPRAAQGPATGGPDPISEIAVLWLTAGLGCDGDTIAMTASVPVSARSGEGMDDVVVLLEARLAELRSPVEASVP